MNAVVGSLLVFVVLSSWIAALAFLRLKTPLERLHVVTFANVLILGAIVCAGFASRGMTSQTLKFVLLWLVNLAAGALLSHATARALHLRGGEAR